MRVAVISLYLTKCFQTKMILAYSKAIKGYRALIQSWTRFVVLGQNSFLSNPYHFKENFLHGNTDLHVE